MRKKESREKKQQKIFFKRLYFSHLYLLFISLGVIIGSINLYFFVQSVYSDVYSMLIFIFSASWSYNVMMEYAEKYQNLKEEFEKIEEKYEKKNK